MKKFFIPLLVTIILPISFSCSSSQKTVGYVLNEKDATEAIRQLLQLGTEKGGFTNAFSKENIMSTIFPASLQKVLNTLEQLGLTNQIDKFTTTLSTAAEKTAERSVPIFVTSIRNMRLYDAMRIIKNGGTSATDYLRSVAGDTLRRSVTPVMKEALDQYSLTQQWDDLIRPVKLIAGDKVNLDISNLMAGVVTEVMFQKMAASEQQIRTDASARPTGLLRKVFSRSWN